MNYVTVISHWLIYLPANTWYHFAEFLVTGAGISALVKVITHIKEWHGKTTLLQSLVAGFSYVAVTLQSLITSHVVNISALGKAGATLAVASTFAYRFAVSPLYKKFSTLIEDAGVGAAAKAAGIPVPSAPTTPVDTFSV